MAQRRAPLALGKNFNARDEYDVDPDEESPIVKQKGDISFEFKMICLAAILFIYPITLCMELEKRQSVTVFISPWMYFLIGICVPMWLLVCSLALLNRWIQRTHAAAWLLLIPSICLIIGFTQQHLQFRSMSAELLADGCETPSKARLEQAFTSAQSVMDDCSSALSNMTGATATEARPMIRIMDCAGYQEGQATYKAEWRYFEYMERTYHCGGWCEPRWPIWYPASSVQDGCSLVAGRVLGGVAERMSKQVLVYSSVLAVVVILALFFMPGLVGAK